ncbi:MAG: TonB-dependent receptor plug domain-containing protein, partial [Bacteroidetes bacterium]|nr:TonB-dependent receptor plug domain-containing protein [Bacteroidota bacterium]
MKISAVCLLAFSLHAAAAGYAQKVSLKRKDVPLDKVFREIRRQTGYSFVYTEALLRKTKYVTVDINNLPVEQALDICFRDQPVTYTIVNKVVVLKEKENAILPAADIPPPPIEIKGKISNSKGEPLAGATIAEKGRNNSVSSAEDGSFTIHVAGKKSVLLITYVGYEPKEISVGAQSDFSIALQPSGEKIQEVVITALGFEAKKDKLGYASSKVRGDQVANSGEVGLIDALGGKASGVRVSRSSGSDPGSSSQVLIRGQSTITRSTDPLIVLDGVPVNGSSRSEGTGGTTQQSRLNDINPDDIASIQVLKGASAAALWGTKAANGVLVITTKAGAGNRTNITFKSTYSIDEVSSFYDLQSGYGQGTGGAFVANNTRSWGDKIANRAGGDDAVNTTGAYFVANN